MRRGIYGLLCGGLLCVASLTSCASPKTDSSTVSVVATFYPLQFVAQRIGGDRVAVTNLVPPGTEPHDWEPSPADVTAIRNAKVFVYQGAGLEHWAERVVRDLPKNGPVVVEATTGMSIKEGIPEEDEATPASGKVLDPHLWLDPLLFAQEAKALAAALMKADPAGKSAYDANLATLQADLTALDGEFRAGLAVCRRRDIVTAHAAFSYLAARYDLQLVPISGISPETEPSPERLRDIVRVVKERGATHIFFETLVSPDLSETIAKEVGAKTLVLDPIEGLTPEDAARGAGYFTLMRQNLANLRLALACHE